MSDDLDTGRSATQFREEPKIEDDLRSSSKLVTAESCERLHRETWISKVAIGRQSALHHWFDEG